MLKIELNPAIGKRWEGADFAVRVRSDTRELQQGDVVSYYTSPNCDKPAKIPFFPDYKFDEVEEKLPDGLRVMIGNAGCEVTFRHISNISVIDLSKLLINWGQRAHDKFPGRLVLGVMDMDIAYDTIAGARFMRWAAKHDVPLLIFCGYRFLFEPDAFSHIAHCAKTIPFETKSLKYPYKEVSSAIKSTGVEIWTGAGFHEGLQCGVMDKAYEFGMKGVVTTRPAWEKGLKLAD